MSVRNIQCPKCSVAASVATTATKVRCPKCRAVWSLISPPPEAAAESAKSADTGESEPKQDVSQALVAARILGGLSLVFIVIGIGLYGVSSLSGATEKTRDETAGESEVVEFKVEVYRVIDLPENTRKRIYKDVRTVARTSREKPLLIPEGSPIRKMTEDTLQATYDRELRRFAALHDVSLDDIGEVIKEGNAEIWDPLPRSSATRGGVRLYPKEMRRKD